VFVVDTNILVYAANRDAPLHSPCRKLLSDWRLEPSAWYITWGIAYEFVRVTTHSRVFRSPLSIGQAWRFIRAVIASPFVGVLQPTDRHAQTVEAVFGELPHIQGNLVHEAATAILMREHGIRDIFTCDTDFHRFPFLNPIHPDIMNH
jgi:toxin-antitoxin system PIN domain toxin